MNRTPSRIRAALRRLEVEREAILDLHRAAHAEREEVRAKLNAGQSGDALEWLALEDRLAELDEECSGLQDELRDLADRLTVARIEALFGIEHSEERTRKGRAA